MIANKTDTMGMKAPARSWKRSTQAAPARKESSKRAVSLEAFGPRKRGWGLGLRAGLCLGLGFLALVGIYQPSTADPLPRRVGALGRGMAFLPADALAVQRGSPAWPLGIEEGHSRNARIGPLAATTSGGTDALGGAPLPGEAPAPPTSQALKDAPASLDESFLPGRPTDARRGAANLARAFSPRAKEAIQGGAPLEAGAKRRTGVVVSLEEEIRAKAREPKPRIKVQDPMPTYRLTQPSYPGAALKDGTEGFVRARFRVSALGTVGDFQVKLSQPPGFFDQVVKEAVEQWKFTPARDQDGKPMEAWMQYNFQLDHKGSLSFGKTIGRRGDSSLGIVGALNWANRYQNIPNESRRFVANTGTTDKPVSEVISDFKFDTSVFESELSALLNLTYEINPGQKIGVRSLYTRSAEDQVRLQAGFDSTERDPVDVTLLRWVERSLFNVQPYGEHLLVGDTLLEWKAGYALSQRDEPDNRQVRYLVDPRTKIKTFEFVSGSGRRDFYLLDENIYDATVDYSIPFDILVPDKNPDPDKKNPDQKIKFGPAFLLRDRHLDTRKFRITSAGGSIPLDDAGQPIDFASDPENLFKRSNLNPKGLFYEEVTTPTDNYTAKQTILAGYGLADFRVFEDLRLQVGARVESSRQEVDTFSLFSQGKEAIKTKLETTDVLPAANLTWEFWREQVVDTKGPGAPPEKKEPQTMLLRLGGSQTVSRPEFRELAPFDYNDVLGGYVSRGNPDLKRAKVINLDLAWEWYLSPGEILSAGLFYKNFKDPIEVVSRPLSSTLLTTWENADSADLYGFEVEASRKRSLTVRLVSGNDSLGEERPPMALTGSNMNRHASRSVNMWPENFSSDRLKRKLSPSLGKNPAGPVVSDGLSSPVMWSYQICPRKLSFKSKLPFVVFR